MIDLQKIRRDFPALERTVRGKPLVYLDNAATAQKPNTVIDAISRTYSEGTANIHRGAHFLGDRTTESYEAARRSVQRFIGATKAEEIVFVRGTTEAINLVAHSFCGSRVGDGDEIVISQMEHHSNIVPWTMLAETSGAKIRVLPIDERGELEIESLDRLLGPRTKLVAVCHVSNVLGTLNPIRRIAEIAHARGVSLLVDGAQSAPHLSIDVKALGCDFYCFSGHKLYGPTGIGVLYGREELLDEMAPYQGGGGMITEVRFDRTRYKTGPEKFEAGTPDIAGAIGLGAAIEYLGGIDRDAARRHESELIGAAVQKLRAIPGLRIIGDPETRIAAVSFVIEGIHPHDLATVLDSEGVAIRAGHHCAQPLMERLGLPATARASFAIYNALEEIDRLAAALHRAKEVFRA